MADSARRPRSSPPGDRDPASSTTPRNDLIERNLAAGPRRQGRLHRRRRPLHYRRPRGAREPRGERADRPRARHGRPHHAVPSRHDGLAGRVPRRDQGRHRPHRGQHAADVGRLRVHAQRQPGQGAGRVGAALAAVRADPRALPAPQARRRLRRRRAQAAERGCRTCSRTRAFRSTAAPTNADDPCFWLYSSGSTGTPKGTVHIQSSMMYTAELYGRPVLGIRDGRRGVLRREAVLRVWPRERVELPARRRCDGRADGGAADSRCSFQAAEGAPADDLLRRADALRARCSPARSCRSAIEALNLRVCTSAGEALPADIGRRWTEHFGVEILDGIGSTEMLHIFLSNRPGEVRYGTSGKAVPGYRLRVVDEQGKDAAPDEIGDLLVAGPTRGGGLLEQPRAHALDVPR